MPTSLAGRLLWRWLAGGLLTLFVSGVVAQDASSTLSERYPAGSIATVEAAASAQQQAASEDARIEQAYAQEEQACGKAFFVNACRDKAKERRRAALEPVRRIRIEADTLMRRMRVVDRDKALADRQMERAAEAPGIEQNAQKKAQEIAQKQARNTEKEQQRVQNEQLHAQDAGQRTASSRTRQQRLQAGVAADAQKRADNVAAYDRKIREAQAHQRDLAARKAEKDRNRKAPPSPEPALATPASKP
ncbi:hypothetical protein [Herminiimonas sp. CN]|uniref:hypothetical protein n=1 Tax=Herminiimonas sp. CN TaxID=1349818 RepID=UPI0012DC0E1A|nr:hypothetical protein [Herminiimonas sp. CN]